MPGTSAIALSNIFSSRPNAVLNLFWCSWFTAVALDGITDTYTVLVAFSYSHVPKEVLTVMTRTRL